MRRPTVVAIGDSITLGVGDTAQGPGGDLGWAAHVARALGARAFINLAQNGTRARDLWADQLPAALEWRPDIALLTVAGNDVLRGDFSAEEVRSATADAIRALRTAGAVVVLASLVPMRLLDILPSSVANVMNARVARANDALVAAADEAGARVIDGAAVVRLQGDSAWHVDRIHPSPIGHRAVATRALGLLPEFAQRSEIAPASPGPGRAATALWLARCGVPWIAKRSRDLIPQVAAVVARDLREARRAEARAARALIDERGRVRAYAAWDLHP
jgi:lysophospholipase L1-like esterase